MAGRTGLSRLAHADVGRRIPVIIVAAPGTGHVEARVSGPADRQALMASDRKRQDHGTKRGRRTDCCQSACRRVTRVNLLSRSKPRTHTRVISLDGRRRWRRWVLGRSAATSLVGPAENAEAQRAMQFT